MCMVSRVPSVCIAHTLAHTLQPTAHLASMEYPLNISLYSLSTHHGSRFFSSWWIHIQICQQQRLSRVSVGMFFSCFHFQNPVRITFLVWNTHTSNIYVTQIAFVISVPCCTFQKTYSVCLQLSVTRVWRRKTEPRWWLEQRLMTHLQEFVFHQSKILF